MSTPAHLIIGLGNPGDDYIRTRHNIGFKAVEAIADRYACPGWKKKFRGLIAEAHGFLLLKPQTFMNLSGESAAEALNFYQLPPERVIVLMIWILPQAVLKSNKAAVRPVITG